MVKNVTYVISDIHGMYEKFIAMLEKISFASEDELFILGDIVDRGNDPVKILEYIIDKPNIIPLLGNHEVMALDILKRINVEITSENAETQIDKQTISDLMDYQLNGGVPTLKGFKALAPDKRNELIDFMEDFLPYEAIDIGDKTFVLIHAGLGNFSEDKRLSEYTLSELLEMRPDYERQYFSDNSIYIVSGHTPTQTINGKAEIYQTHNNIAIDCGAAFGGRLACLRLEDMKEFYV